MRRSLTIECEPYGEHNPNGGKITKHTMSEALQPLLELNVKVSV